MKEMARRFASGASHEETVRIVCKTAATADLNDLLNCDGIAIGTPEYFGTMAGMIKDFFDRTYESAKEKTVGLPYLIFVCAGNDGLGAITQVERIAAGYRWKKAQDHFKVVGKPTEQELANLEELGNALAAGIGLGIF